MSDFERHPTSGAPYIKHPETGKKSMYGRASSGGKQLDDTRALEQWQNRMVALGVAMSVEAQDMIYAIRDGDKDSREWKDEMDEAIELALKVSKAKIAAERGTYAHLLVEEDGPNAMLAIGTKGTRQWVNEDEVKEIVAGGILLDVHPNSQRVIVQAWRDLIEAFELEVLTQEHRVVCDEWRLAGTLDGIARLGRDISFRLPSGEIVDLFAGEVVLLDTKTGRFRRDPKGFPLYWSAYAAQLHAYVNALPYNVTTGLRESWPTEWGIMNQKWALIVHIPVAEILAGTQTTAELVLVDVEVGGIDLGLVAQIKENRKLTRFGVLGPNEPAVVIEGIAKLEQAEKPLMDRSDW